jgi:hypothetical protein
MKEVTTELLSVSPSELSSDSLADSSEVHGDPDPIETAKAWHLTIETQFDQRRALEHRVPPLLKALCSTGTNLSYKSIGDTS